MTTSIRAFVGVVLMVAMCNMLSAQTVPAAETPNENTIDRLVIGDQYTIAVKRNDLEKQYAGELVKANDHWIVLRNVREERTEFGVPILSKVPYVNRMFKNVGIGRNSDILWLPREFAAIKGRTRSINRDNEPTDLSSLPHRRRHCTLDYFDNDKLVECQGTLKKSTNEHFTIVEERYEEVVQGVPYAKNMPYVGSLFRRTVTRRSEIVHELDRDDILCITQDEIGNEVLEDELATSE
jgi:hypothetical protein